MLSGALGAEVVPVEGVLVGDAVAPLVHLRLGLRLKSAACVGGQQTLLGTSVTAVDEVRKGVHFSAPGETRFLNGELADEGRGAGTIPQSGHVVFRASERPGQAGVLVGSA